MVLQRLDLGNCREVSASKDIPRQPLLTSHSNDACKATRRILRYQRATLSHTRRRIGTPTRMAELGPEGGSSPLLPTTTSSEPVLALSRDFEAEDIERKPDLERQPTETRTETASQDLEQQGLEQQDLEQQDLVLQDLEQRPSPEDSPSDLDPWQQVRALEGMMCTRDMQLQDLNRLFECAMDENRRLQDHIIRLRTFMARQLGTPFHRPPSPFQIVEPASMDQQYYQARAWSEELSAEDYPDQTVQDIKSNTSNLSLIFNTEDEVEFVNVPELPDDVMSLELDDEGSTNIQTCIRPELSDSDSQLSYSSLGGQEQTRKTSAEGDFREVNPVCWPRAHSHCVIGRGSRAREERRQRKMSLSLGVRPLAPSLGRPARTNTNKSQVPSNGALLQEPAELEEDSISEPAGDKIPSTSHPEPLQAERPATARVYNPVFTFSPSEDDTSVYHGN